MVAEQIVVRKDTLLLEFFQGEMSYINKISFSFPPSLKKFEESICPILLQWHSNFPRKKRYSLAKFLIFCCSRKDRLI